MTNLDAVKLRLEELHLRSLGSPEGEDWALVRREVTAPQRPLAALVAHTHTHLPRPSRPHRTAGAT